MTRKPGHLSTCRHAAAAACIVLTLSLLNCSSGKRSETGGVSAGETAKNGSPIEVAENVFARGGNNFVKVTYKPQVKMIDEAQVDASLLGIASNGDDVVFRNAAAPIRALKAGDVFFVKDQLVRKVIATENQGDLTVVLTDQAALSDVVDEGDMQIETAVDFRGHKRSAAICPSVPRFFDIFEETAYAQTPSDLLPCWKQGRKSMSSLKSIIGAAIADWNVTDWTVTSGDGVLNFNLALTKNIQGFAATLIVTGFVTNFELVTNIHSARGAATKMWTAVKNMRGSLHVDWDIRKGSPGVWAQEDRIPLPAGLTLDLSPFTSGMPLQLDISSALLVHPALTGGNELSAGGFTVKWMGHGNFSFERGTNQTSASPGGTGSGDTDLQIDVTQDTNVSPIAPNAMVLSVCIPRLELRYKVWGKYGKALCWGATALDAVTTGVRKVLGLLTGAHPSDESTAAGVAASKVLASSADVFVQFVTTEGVTHSSTLTAAPCSKQEVRFSVQGGAEAQLLGLTPGAHTTTELLTKTFTRWDPASDFCKSVGK